MDTPQGAETWTDATGRVRLICECGKGSWYVLLGDPPEAECRRCGRVYPLAYPVALT